MTKLRDLDLTFGYMGKGREILESFTLPCLRAALSYDRITSYYNFASLLALADGLQSLYENHGCMRLILGVHSIPSEIIDATLRRQCLAQEITRIREDIERGISTLTDSLQRKSVATLGWMIEDGLLEVKVAALEGDGIFHPKTLIFRDDIGDRVVAVGSSNETSSGNGSNFEQLMVVNSWTSEGAVSTQEAFFTDLWNNRRTDACVGDITLELIESIRSSMGDEYYKPNIVLKHSAKDIIKIASEMPANFFVSGCIPALYQHQERAVIDALSRWPVRVLFADEVGLGKTFEVAATIAFLTKYCDVKRVLILTPKAVLQQWQDELAEHFGMEAWLYDSSTKSYVGAAGKRIPMGRANPLGHNSPNIMLMSAQYARGSGRQKSVLERQGAVLPDLLVLDEAHSARVSADLSGSKKTTRIYEMLKEFAPKIPHVILATATPMQKEPSEYHSMLKLLGLPNAWKRSRAYQASLRLTIDDNIPSTADAYTAGKLLQSTIMSMNPSLADLSPVEESSLRGLIDLGNADHFDVANYVIEHWSELKTAFIKLHPAHLLTVRNTRRSLTKMGYRFPKRNLHAESIYDSAEVQLFYMRVDDYISNLYFSVEKALHPDKRMNVGFVRIGYQQRLASSLQSCKISLSRRLDKLVKIKSAIAADATTLLKNLGDGTFTDLDDFFYDDAMLVGNEEFEHLDSIANYVDSDALNRALGLETSAIATLIEQVTRLLEECGDLKISRAVQLAFKHLDDGDRVLVFSRYTDTVNALIETFRSADKKRRTYGIYTGQKSVSVTNGIETQATKSAIRYGLESGAIPIIFCSDAASEGLNLQAARVLINVDVPWTPSRLEQRIGRVARLGQKAKEVEIYNIWYPNSVEAKMYGRIDKRLKDMNLAIGEFPQVVSDRIRDSILNGEERDDLYELQEIRNSVQTKALSRLWSEGNPKVTTSRHIRNGLISLCNRDLHVIKRSADATTYRTSSNMELTLSADEGRPESVSYLSLLGAGLEYELSNCYVRHDSCGNPAAFEIEDSPIVLNHEAIVDVLLGDAGTGAAQSSSYPKMLPDNLAMQLDFAITCQIPPRPSFWPPVI